MEVHDQKTLIKDTNSIKIDQKTDFLPEKKIRHSRLRPCNYEGSALIQTTPSRHWKGCTHGRKTTIFPRGKNALQSRKERIISQICYTSLLKFWDLGPMGLKNYRGSGLCGKKCRGEEGIIYQPAHGKWSSYNTTYTYGMLTLKTSTYASPGTYTAPAYDITVY